MKDKVINNSHFLCCLCRGRVSGEESPGGRSRLYGLMFNQIN